jgi:hypothetical protein
VADLLLAANAGAANLGHRAPLWQVVVAGLLAAAITAGTWVLTHAPVTIAHEGGHAMAASAVGLRVFDIRLHRHGGVTNVHNDGNEAKQFLVGLSGYVGPSVFGLGGAVLLSTGRVAAVLWLSLGLLACVLWLAEDRYSRVATAVVAGLILLVIRYAGAGTQTFFAYTWVWFLLIGGMRSVLDLSAIRASGGDTTSDAYKLGRMAYLPAMIFVGFFAVVCFAAMVAGGLIMVGALGRPAL